MDRNDDWFMEFINQFKPWIGRADSDYIGKALDLLMGGEAGKNEWKYNISSVPFIGDFYKWQDANNFWSDYFAAKGLDWSKVQYPTMMMGSGSAANAVNHGADMVLSKSRTLTRLYEGLGQDQGDWTPAKHHQPSVSSNIGIRKINGRGQFYRWDY